jgi:hypothetical protein
VYDASLLMNTRRLLARRSVVSVPGDVQGLIDAVYEDENLVTGNVAKAAVLARAGDEAARRQLSRLHGSSPQSPPAAAPRPVPDAPVLPQQASIWCTGPWPQQPARLRRRAQARLSGSKPSRTRRVPPDLRGSG